MADKKDKGTIETKHFGLGTEQRSNFRMRISYHAQKCVPLQRIKAYGVELHRKISAKEESIEVKSRAGTVRVDCYYQ